MDFLEGVEAFSPTAVCFGGEQNREGYGSQSGQYLHSWSRVVIDGIRAGPVIPCGLRDTFYGIRAGPVIPCGLRDTTLQSGP